MPTLRKVASITGAKTYLGKDTETLNKIFEEIDELETSDIEYRQIIKKKYYQWPTFLAASLLLLELVGETQTQNNHDFCRSNLVVG